jgi:hypothetical protein
MGRIRKTIELAKASWEVLKADKELLVLPVLSFVATLAVAASFLAPIVMSGDGAALEDPGIGSYVLLFIAYLVLAFITIFFNAALVHAANERLSGGDPTVGSALRGAASRIGGILPWAIVSATVSVIIRAIQDRGALGQIVGSIAGIAWSLITFLVVPVLVVERVGAIEAVKRSGTLFKATWGENVAARIGFGLLGFLLVIPAVLLMALGFMMGEAIGVGALIVGVVWMLLVALVLSALNGIFQTALYRYAAGAEGDIYFGRGELQHAFGPKKSRSGW